MAFQGPVHHGDGEDVVPEPLQLLSGRLPEGPPGRRFCRGERYVVYELS